MIIEKLETRQQWLCVVNEIQYVRTQIHWNNDIQDDVTWHLNKDYVQGEIYLNEEELEELFKNKEVMKKEQTIEQASEYYAHNYFDMHETNNYKALKEGFVNGAKWQQDKNKYSEEEVLAFGKSCFYKGFEKAENDDANCYTAFREEIGSLIKKFKNK